MPRIPDQLQRSVVYLYPNVDAARTGSGVGGTGFFVALRDDPFAESFQYLVTNIHVSQTANRTVRINTTDGGVETIEVPSSAWVNHPNGDDIAAAALTLQPNWAVTALDWSTLAVTPSRIADLNMGVGDEVFMLGRFISHDNLQLNQSLARFGNIAMMPGDPVEDGRNLLVEAFLVEMRSLSGFSGSPVFVHIGPGTYRGNGTMMPFYTEAIGLMGIDTGHKAVMTEVRQKREGAKTDLEVPLNTGISIVAPVWRIREVLDADIFKAKRAHPQHLVQCGPAE